MASMIAASLALLAAMTSAPADAPRRLNVLVTIDARPLESYVDVSGVIREIQALWKPYADIDVAVSGNGAAVFAAAGQRRGPYDDRVRLAVVGRPEDAASAGSLGWIAFSGPGQPLSEVRVSIAAATALMMKSRSSDRRIVDLPKSQQRQFITRAVGRSAAHEIGHYLLRSSAHSPRGLMRAQMSGADIVENNLAVFRLEPSQVDIIHRRASLAGLIADGDSLPVRVE